LSELRRPRRHRRDASWAWTPTAAGDPLIAIAAIERLKPLGSRFVEQPVWAGDPAEMAEVRLAWRAADQSPTNRSTP